MQKNNLFPRVALISCVLIIIVCFMPWVHFNSINVTFTGFNVTKFASGVYYGKPGIVISFFAGIIFLLNLWNNINAKRANLFVSALLLAYCIRTYVLFTGSLFDGEVARLAGIYQIVFLSSVLMVCSVFPKK